jgi:hypothetical protein
VIGFWRLRKEGSELTRHLQVSGSGINRDIYLRMMCLACGEIAVEIGFGTYLFGAVNLIHFVLFADDTVSD